MLWTFSTVLLVLGLLGLVGGWTLVAFIDSLLVLAILFIFLELFGDQDYFLIEKSTT